MSGNKNEIGLSFLREKGTNFPHKPKLVEDVSTFLMPDGLGLQCRGLANPVVLRGPLVDKVLPELLGLLDGTRSASELFQHFEGRQAKSDIADLLMNLFTRGLIAGSNEPSLVDSDPVEKRHLLYLSRRLGVTRFNDTASDAYEKIKNAPVLVIGDGILGLCTSDILMRSGIEKLHVACLEEDTELAQLFLELPARSVDKIAKSAESVQNFLQKCVSQYDFIVVALRNAPNVIFDAVNQICVDEGKEWMRMHDNGSVIEVGPYVNPHDTPCLECMTIRRISVDEHAVEEELFQQALETGAASNGLRGESLPLCTMTASYLSAEIVRLISGTASPSMGGKVTYFYSDGNIEQNSFIRVPRCQVCSRCQIVSVPGVQYAE